MEQPELVISLRNLSKEFAGGRRALDGVDLDVRPGEIHGLLGQNGSGKSTLIKILAGYHAPERGAELRVNGEPISLPIAPGRFRELGMSFVHQNLGLSDTMSVLDNVRVGRYERGFGWRIPWRSERRGVREGLRRFGLDLDLDTLVSDLPQGTRAVI
ncbi:MAG: ribose transport system ATP-binding protein, partial [Solirubrobacteraceae bacterium]|nr:ribose transport system ATP-binding protein [Solirubrobacteraceae bacterium]